MAVEWIFAPRDSASDDVVTVVTLLVDEGSTVSAGRPIVELEGSKSVFEVEASHQGVIFFWCNEGDEIKIGQTVACVCTDGEDRPAHAAPPVMVTPEADAGASSTDQSPANPAVGVPRASTSAVALAEAEGLDLTEAFPQAVFVTLADVELLLGRTASGGRNADSHAPPVSLARIALLGGGGLATLAWDALRSSHSSTVVGVFDDKRSMLSAEGIDVIGALNKGEVLDAFARGTFDAALVTIGTDMSLRTSLFSLCRANAIPLATAIHPRASISPSAVIGPGCIVPDMSRVGPNATLGEGVKLSAGVSIEHDCSVGAMTTFGPGVLLSGDVTVGEACTFGMNVGVEPHLTLGDGCLVASGVVVQTDVPSGTVVKAGGRPSLRIRPDGDVAP